ncbi:unknown [Bacteroides sp. CAG:927]|nr:unknown [Bacteroides sp. CAG:927]
MRDFHTLSCETDRCATEPQRVRFPNTPCEAVIHSPSRMPRNPHIPSSEPDRYAAEPRSVRSHGTATAKATHNPTIHFQFYIHYRSKFHAGCFSESAPTKLTVAFLGVALGLFH